MGNSYRRLRIENDSGYLVVSESAELDRGKMGKKSKNQSIREREK